MKKLIFLLIIGFGLLTACNLLNPDAEDNELKAEKELMKTLSDGDVFVYTGRVSLGPGHKLTFYYLDNSFVEAKSNRYEASSYKLLNDSTLEVALNDPFENIYRLNKIGVNYYDYGTWSDHPNVAEIYNGLWKFHERFTGIGYEDIYFAIDMKKKKAKIWFGDSKKIINSDITIEHNFLGFPYLRIPSETYNGKEVWRLKADYNTKDKYHTGTCGVEVMQANFTFYDYKNGTVNVDDKTEKNHSYF